MHSESHKKTSHIIWTTLAWTLGILLSYALVRGITYAYNYIMPDLGSTITETYHNQVAQIPLPPLPKPKGTVSIGFVGDIIPGPNSNEALLLDAAPYTERPDIMIGNFEGVAARTLYTKCKTDSKKCFSFNGDTKFLSHLKAASFDVLNVANNHFNDYGEVGQTETLTEIQNLGMIPSGTKDQITYLEKNNIRIGILGVSNYAWTTNMLSAKSIEKLVREAKQNADIVIILFHGGGEGANYSHTPPDTEWYLDENRGDLRAFSHLAIDSGADAVLGSGPHVLRGMEIYNDKLIAYSLGNFASANPTIITSGPMKTSALLHISFNKDGTLASGNIFPFEIDRSGIPHPDINNTAISVINKLSFEDFGASGILLDTNGKLILD